jgi:hypothetical protein
VFSANVLAVSAPDNVIHAYMYMRAGLNGNHNGPKLAPTSAHGNPYGPNMTPKGRDLTNNWLQGGPKMDGPNWAHVALIGAAAHVASLGKHLLTFIVCFPLMFRMSVPQTT